MKTVAWDTETELIAPGNLAPRMVCLTSCQDGEDPQLFLAEEGCERLGEWLCDRDVMLVGQNVAYDVAVAFRQCPDLVEPFFDAYNQSRVDDTLIREQLLLIAEGKLKGWPSFRESKSGGKECVWVRPRLDLQGLVKRYAGWDMPKDDTWRLRYKELLGVPLRDWPEDAKRYALNDAKGTYQVWKAQETAQEYIPDRFQQARYALWKHLCSCRGLITDPRAVLRFKYATEEELESLEEHLIAAGLVRPGGTRNMKAAQEYMRKVCEEQGIVLRKTPAEGVALDADACEATDDQLLMDYANYSTLKAALSKDVPMLAAGTSKPVHTSFGMAESGRTTSRSNKALGAGTGNLQNLRRGAKQRKGESKEDFEARKHASGDVRECFIPRPGYTFIQADYPGLELRTLGQVCVTLFGRSKLAEALNEGKDPHAIVASTILHQPYEWVIANKKLPEVDNARQTGKVANFGFPGGLGAAKLVLFARKSYRVNITEGEARNLKQVWLATYPEMEMFFDHVNRIGDRVIQLFSNRIRGGCTYCSACNTYFQGLGADASQHAGWLLTQACFLGDGPLRGSRMVNYIHDEFHIETPLGPCAHDAAMQTSQLMMQGANVYLPDVPYKDGEIEPLLMSRWSKAARPVKDEAGRLVPWA